MQLVTSFRGIVPGIGSKERPVAPLASASPSGDKPSSSPSHIPELDGLRGLAAITVVLAHAALPAWLFPGHRYAGYAVYVFFALSGFLITRILLASKEAGEPIGRFYWRRSLRIFPIYYAAIALFSVALSWRTIVTVATYTMNFDPEYHLIGSWFSHVWSLCIEEHFYLLFPWVIYLLPREAARRFTIGIIVVIGIAGFVLSSSGISGLWMHQIFWRWSPFAFPTLGAGALMAFYEKGIRESPSTALWLGAWIWLASLTTDNWVALHPVARSQWSATMIGASIVLMALGVAGTKNMVAEFLSGRILRWVGKISYGLYLYHYPIYQALGISDASPWWKTGLAITASFMMAWCSYRCFEERILRYKDRMPFGRKELANALAAP